MNCPTCERIKNSNGQPVALAHPEEVPYLCPDHLEQLKQWHDSQVEKSFIKPWEQLDKLTRKGEYGN